MKIATSPSAAAGIVRSAVWLFLMGGGLRATTTSHEILPQSIPEQLPITFNEKDYFTENLEIKQFQDGKVLAEFKFETSMKDRGGSRSSNGEGGAGRDGKSGGLNYDLLPRAIGEIVEAFGVQEMHLTFTQGRWQDSRWGLNQNAAPSGAQLVTWLLPAPLASSDGQPSESRSSSAEGEDDYQLKDQFDSLINALAGLFCSSLNFMDKSVTSSPIHAFTPLEPKTLSSEAILKYSHLPREAVCTENLTPWAKLLPCQTKAGLASLLNGYKLFNGNFQSMGIHWAPKCLNIDCSLKSYTFTQTFTVVLDPLRTMHSKEWSFDSLFGSPIQNKCPFAAKSNINIYFTQEDGYSVSPVSSSQIQQGGYQFNYDIFEMPHESLPLNLKVSWQNKDIDNRNPYVSPLTTHRYLGGSGQERGSIKVEFINSHSEHTNISYLESIPWILKTYLHTFKVYSPESRSNGTLIKKLLYTPAIDRERPTVLEVLISLPPHSTTYLSLDYECAYVKIAEHHPDANHGFDIGTGVIHTGTLNMYTESLLIRLPTPDFSMPYNVITLTCTALSMYFGSIFNMLTRKYVPIPIK